MRFVVWVLWCGLCGVRFVVCSLWCGCCTGLRRCCQALVWAWDPWCKLRTYRFSRAGRYSLPIYLGLNAQRLGLRVPRQSGIFFGNFLSSMSKIMYGTQLLILAPQCMFISVAQWYRGMRAVTVCWAGSKGAGKKVCVHMGVV